jgi:O-antigen/teichoic acid export membrane protein
VVAKYKIKERLIQKSKSPFVRSLGVYTMLNFFLKGVSFLITPLFTNYISPAEFGNLNLYLNSINFILPIVSLGISNSISVDYFKYSKEELSRHISSYLLFSFSISLFLVLMAISFGKWIGLYFKLPLLYIAWIPVLCFFNVCIDVIFVLYRNKDLVKVVSIVTIIRSILELTLSVFFIMYLLQGFQGRIWSLLIATGILSLQSLYVLRNKFGVQFQFDFKLIKKEIPFWLSSVAGFFFVLSFSVLDKYIVKYYCSPDELGQYGLATQFGFIILTFTTAVAASFLPNLYRDLSNQVSIKYIYKKVTWICGLLLSVALLSNFAVFLAYRFLINERYATSWKLYIYVSIIYGLWSVITILYGFLTYYKMKRVFSALGLAAILFFIPLQICCIRSFQTIGLFWAQIGYFVVCIFIIIMLVRKQLVNYETNTPQHSARI